MSKKMNLAGLLDICRQREENHSDRVVALSSLSMDANHPGNLIVKRGSEATSEIYPLQEHVYRLVSRVIPDIPAGYLEKCAEKAPDLAARNFNHWVSESKPKDVLLRFTKIKDIQHVRAMLPSSWKPFPYENMIGHLIKTWGSDKEATVSQFTDLGISVDITNGTIDRKAYPGDDIAWGNRFRDSDVGFGNLIVCPYTLRLVCTNGAVSVKEGYGVNFSHTDKAFDDRKTLIEEIGNGIQSISNYAHMIGLQVEKAASIHLNDVDEAFERINKKFTVTKLEAENANDGWDEEEALPDTVYKLAQAYTRGANSGEFDDRVESRFKLQHIGGQILQLAFNNYSFN